MTHDNEYPPNMVTVLELIWGKGYMAPGGPGNVARLLAGTEPQGKRILDIGCGIGGPAFEMLRSHGAQVVGIDLEQPLIERAKTAARELGLQDHCQFHTVSVGALPFSNESFDIVTSSGAITQTGDKSALIKEASRVLTPGGFLSCYEWMRGEQEYSTAMHRWFELEGLTYELETLDALGLHFEESGFNEVTTTDATDWYAKESRREYELLKGELYETMVDLIGKDDADHFVEDWRAMVVVIESGEMRQGYCRGKK